MIRDGKPAAVILDIDEYEALLERAEDVADLEMLRAMRSQPMSYQTLEEFLSEGPGRA